MKKSLLLAATAAAVIGFGQDFTYVSPKLQDYNLVVDFTANGLPRGEMVDFALAGEARAVYACIERGDPAGKRAMDHKIIEKTQWVEGRFIVNSEGWTRQLLALDPPMLPPSEQCADSNHRSVLAGIEYKDVRVVNMRNDQSRKVKGKFSKVFFNLD
ncbi:MAG: hypothetical protein WAO58_00900 [Fimbriimonadaceae bacterium]